MRVTTFTSLGSTGLSLSYRSDGEDVEVVIRAIADNAIRAYYNSDNTHAVDIIIDGLFNED